jgi:hypothetical protein
LSKSNEHWTTNDLVGIGTGLVTDNAQLAKRSRAEKYFLIGLFEQVALLVNSGLMRREVAHYMFGYRAIRCWNSTQFWANLDDKDSDMYVSLFKDFVRQMQEVEASFKFDSGRFRF